MYDRNLPAPMSNNNISEIIEEECLIDLLIKLDLPDEIFPGIPYLDISIPACSKYQPLIPVHIHILYLLLMLVHLLSKTLFILYSYTTTLYSFLVYMSSSELFGAFSSHCINSKSPELKPNIMDRMLGSMHIE